MNPEQLGVTKQLKYAHFHRIISHFGRSKVTECLANGLIRDYKFIEKAVFFIKLNCFTENQSSFTKINIFLPTSKGLRTCPP